MKETNGDWLNGLMMKAVRDGEIPYQSNRWAMQLFDILEEYYEGRKELVVMLDGIDLLIKDLENFKNAADTVSKQSAMASLL